MYLDLFNIEFYNIEKQQNHKYHGKAESWSQKIYS